MKLSQSEILFILLGLVLFFISIFFNVATGVIFGYPLFIYESIILLTLPFAFVYFFNKLRAR